MKGAGADNGIRVQQQQKFSSGLGDCLVVGRGKAEIPVVEDQLNRWELFFDHGGRAVCRSVIDHPDLKFQVRRLFHLDRIHHYGIYDMSSWQLKDTREVEVIQGASLILRREAVDEVGPLDTNFFMYTEEVDLCYRLRNSEWPLYWIPQAEVIHLGGQSTRLVAGDMFLQLYRSKIQFFRKNYGRFAAQVYKIILSLSAVTRLLISPLAWFESPSRRKNHLNLANNYQQLLLKLPGM